MTTGILLAALALLARAPQQTPGPPQEVPQEASFERYARKPPKAPVNPTSGPVAVETWISQTAVWTGDPVEYSVRLVLAPRVQLAEDLSGAQMSWAPFRLLGFSQTQQSLSDSTTAVTLIYRLVPVDLPPRGNMIEVPKIRVGYIASPASLAPGDEVPAQELEVIGPRIAYRSTLERPAEEATIRDGKELMESQLPGRTLLLIGLGGLLLGTWPFVRALQLALSRLLARRRRVDPRAERRQLRADVAALRTAPLAGPEDYERLYAGLFDALRRHLAQAYGLAFPGLTSADVDELRRAGVSDAVADRLETFLRECEEVRYQGAVSDEAERRARDAAGLIEQLVAA